MTTFCPRIAAFLLALACALTLAAEAVAHEPEPRCYEDEPCWTWSTMGNGKRGITLKSGRHVVVGVCRFQRLHHARRIDWTATPRLRGDRKALRYFDCD